MCSAVFVEKHLSQKWYALEGNGQNFGINQGDGSGKCYSQTVPIWGLSSVSVDLLCIVMTCTGLFGVVYLERKNWEENWTWEEKT